MDDNSLQSVLTPGEHVENQILAGYIDILNRRSRLACGESPNDVRRSNFHIMDPGFMYIFFNITAKQCCFRNNHFTETGQFTHRANENEETLFPAHLYSHDLIFFPFSDGAHYSLVMGRINGREIQFTYFDSLGERRGWAERYIERVKAYLEEYNGRIHASRRLVFK